jgi:hypothetical protein
MAEIGTLRRYYLLKARAALAVGDEELYLAWLGKKDQEAGSPLPPGLSATIVKKLKAAGYTAREDLRGEDKRGADEDELRREAELTRKEAAAVLAALGA